MSAPEGAIANLLAVRQAYEEMAGTWTGCDWPTCFGREELDLNGWKSTEASAKAAGTGGTVQEREWGAAAQWLADVERKADEAAVQGALCLAAANAGAAAEALEHARRAWELERASGRPTPFRNRSSWRQLFDTLNSAVPAPASVPAARRATASPPAMEAQLAHLAAEVQRLSRRVDELAAQEKHAFAGIGGRRP